MKSIILSSIVILMLGACSESNFKETTTVSMDANMTIEEPEIINGYILPPEPDETLNNSTLLGIDSNNNGVRDDVERKIVITYKEPIKIELMMAMAEVGQEILNNPVGGTIDNQKKMSRIGDCSMYLKRQKKRPSNRFAFYENNVYNTK